MSEKKNIAREIATLEEEIGALENKRSRSQAALLESLISKTDPPEEEVQFFRTFTAEIEIKRKQLIKLTKQLEKLM